MEEGIEERCPDDLLRLILDKKQAPERGIEMYVLAVLKFIHDCFSLHLGDPNDQSCEGYDVILTDGQCLSKALIGKSDNRLMQKQIIVPGCKISILGLSQQSNVSNDSADSFFYPVISKLSMVSTPADNSQMEPSLAKLRSSEEYAACLVRPLFSHRRYYCSMWSSMDPPVGWVPVYPDSSPPTAADLMHKHIPLSEVVRGVSSTVSVCYSSVVGRVLTKSSVIHYAKPTDQYTSPYPFQFYIELCDGTQSVPVVFWNGNCLKWYREVHVGDVLVLSRFTVRDVQDAKASTYNRLTQLRHSSDSHQVELNLNCDRKPLAEIRKVLEDDVASSVHLPEVSVDVNFISAVLKAEEPVVGTVGGVIVYVSRLERAHRLTASPGVLPGRPPPSQDRKILPFVQYRWVALVDPSSSSPLLVQVASCSQPEEFAQLVVGRTLVITNANVWPHLRQPHGSTSRERTVFATTSLESQLYLVDEDCPSFLSEDLEGLLTWRQTSRCHDALKQFSSNLAVLPSPLLPNSIPQLQLLIGQPNSDIEVVPSDPALLSLVAGLHHHQVRHVVLTATIVAIQVVAPPNAPPPEEDQPPDSALYSQESQSGCISMDTITDETWDTSAHPATEVGVWSVIASQTVCSSWNLKLLTEERTAVVNARFAPLLADHWMAWTSPPPTRAKPHLAMLSCGVCTRADLPDVLSSARDALFQVTFSCLLALYQQPGGEKAVHATLLRAFPLQG